VVLASKFAPMKCFAKKKRGKRRAHNKGAAVCKSEIMAPNRVGTEVDGGRPRPGKEAICEPRDGEVASMEDGAESC